MKMLEEKTFGFLTPKIIVDVSTLLLISLPLLFLHLMVQPTERGFFCDDKSLMLPYKSSTVSVSILMTGCFAVPLITLLATEIKKSFQKERVTSLRSDLEVAFKGYSVLMFAMAADQLFTDITKHLVCRLRPHFFDLCKPDFTKINCSSGYITEYSCQATDFTYITRREMFMSFPSGHASLATACAVYTALYLQVRFSCQLSTFLKPTLQCCVLLLAVGCGFSRIVDNKHFMSDILAGFLYGFVVAVLTFQYIFLPTLKVKARPSLLTWGMSTGTTISDIEPQIPAQTPFIQKDAPFASATPRKRSDSFH